MTKSKQTQVDREKIPLPSTTQKAAADADLVTYIIIFFACILSICFRQDDHAIFGELIG